MLTRLATPLRGVLVLMLFSLGVTTHDVAMGAVPAAVDTPPMGMSMAGAMDMDGMHAQTCKAQHCDPVAPPCCVMGQCLIGIQILATLVLATPLRPQQIPGPLMVPAFTIPDLPFRPPTLMRA